MDWTEPKLFEREYRIHPKGDILIARLGFPRPSEWENEWECPFQLVRPAEQPKRHA